MTSVEVVVDDDHRTVPVTQRTPAYVIVSMIPVDPCRPPIARGNPVPTKGCPPVPASIPVRAPTPRIVGNPGPSDYGVPHPAAIVVRPPVRIPHLGNPDISIGRFIHPTAVIGQFHFVLIEFSGEIAPLNITGLHLISRVAPVCKTVVIARIGPLGV